MHSNGTRNCEDRRTPPVLCEFAFSSIVTFLNPNVQSFKYLKNKPVEEMSRSSQFLHILTAEAQHAVTISISLDPHTKSDFENRLISAFASDGYSETAAAWNEQRATVVREAMEQYLVPIGIKFTRDWLREEAEDFVAWRCATALRNVCPLIGIHVPSLTCIAAHRRLPVRYGQHAERRDPFRSCYVLGLWRHP
jgi:hypothetical protein